MEDLVSTPAEMLDDLLDFYEKLSDWEQNFIDSIDDQLNEDKKLTDLQLEKLEEIWFQKGR